MPFDLLAAAAVAVQAPMEPRFAPALTREEARTEPVDVLARRLLGATGALMREVGRPPAEPWFGEMWLRELTFATAPRWSRIAGLCEADLFILLFQPAGEAAEGREPPVRVSDLAVVRRFRAIGDPATAGAHWTEEEQRRYDPACATSGPVLGAGSRWFGGTSGGNQLTNTDAAFAIRVYRQAIAGALSPSPCTDDPSAGVPALCTDPRTALTSLPADGPMWFEIAACRGAAHVLCVTAFLPRTDDPDPQRRVWLTIRTDRQATYPRPVAIGITSIALAASTIVY